jgi:aminoglycoside phosphotransferase family enzyme/predicted kinase
MIDALLSPAAYAHPVGRIECLETHISWVILTGEFAYKIKKPVDLGFLDFRTLEQRRHFCEEELRLNRAWASRLYLDVVPIVEVDGGVRVDGEGEPVDYAVRMRQFDQAMRLDHLVDAGRLTVDDVLELAEEIARRHIAARRVSPDPHLRVTTERLIWDNFRELQGEVPDVFLRRLESWMRRAIERHEALLGDRIGSGWYRECHGDLHLANIVRLPEGIRAFDCIEFSRELRQIDVVADYAFLTMDFIARGSVGYAYTFVNRYLEKTGDYDGARLLPLYLLYRAMVRAKVAAIGSEQHRTRNDNAGDRHTLRRYCALARALVSERRPLLVLMTGLSGSGKTWLSTRLVPLLPALRLRSDLERRRQFDLAESAHSDSGIATGIYDPGVSSAVYDHLLDSAADLLDAGINVILDAAFLDAGNRLRARRVAEAHGVRCVTIRTVADPATLRERLQRRAGTGDASEADNRVLRYQLDTVDPLTPREREMTLTVDTEDEVDAAAIAARIRELTY